MTYYININKHIIRDNIKGDKPLRPPIRVTKGKSGKGKYYYEVKINGPSSVVYQPHVPILKCGARLVIKCDDEPTGIEHDYLTGELTNDPFS